MKRFLFAILLLLASLVSIQSAPAGDAPIGKATEDFDNSRPQQMETPFGRLAADALQAATKADLALLDAGQFQPGVLKAGTIKATAIDVLIKPDDEVVTVTVTGAQLRAALERAVQAYPTDSYAFLHGAGFMATFNAQVKRPPRITMVRVKGREVEDNDSFIVAMPKNLAKGGTGYFTIWNDPQGTRAKRWNINVRAAIVNFVRARGEITPNNAPRIAPQ